MPLTTCFSDSVKVHTIYLFSHNFLYAGYGHIDVFIGKNARRDVWPKLVAEFDKYAENNALEDEGLLSRVHKALDKVKDVSRQIRSKLHCFVVQFCLLKPCHTIQEVLLACHDRFHCAWCSQFEKRFPGR